MRGDSVGMMDMNDWAEVCRHKPMGDNLLVTLGFTDLPVGMVCMWMSLVGCWQLSDVTSARWLAAPVSICMGTLGAGLVFAYNTM